MNFTQIEEICNNTRLTNTILTIGLDHLKECVVLVDEFDKPIINLMFKDDDNEEKINEIIEVQKLFYATLKTYNGRRQLIAALAGQVKISKSSIYSGKKYNLIYFSFK